MADIHVVRDDLLPAAAADAAPPDLDRRPRRATTSSGCSRPPRTFERSLEREVKKLPTLRGRTVVNLFYESSTRTSSSFELAAKRLSADDDVDQGGRLVGRQGRVAEGHGAHARRLRPGRDRHPPPADRRAAARRARHRRARRQRRRRQAPAPDPGAARPLHDRARSSAGIEGLHVAIVGDVLHSRVARSNIQALVLMGARVTLVGPPPLIPRGIEAMGCEVSHRHRRDRATPTSSTSCACSASGCRRARTTCPSLREYTRALGRHARAAAAGPEGHAPGPDEPRRRDRRRASPTRPTR